jgi:DNA gyrase/topoisomerase IV subunit A
MVTKKNRTKFKPSAPITSANKALHEHSILEYSLPAMTRYAAEVNLDRAVPDLIDGLKPVQRRILWAASQQPTSQLVKSARTVGDTMGKYHPHGDSSIYGAMVTMVKSCVPLIYGSGNWGNLVDSPAAMRYTEARLTKFGLSAFDSDYTNKEVTTFVPSYDDKNVEPVTIPYPLPVILFNGGYGIGYGTACTLPSFTPESVVVMLKRILKGDKLETIDFAKTLKPSQRYGGHMVKSKANNQAWLSMFTSHKASVQFESELKVDSVKRTIVINEWPDGLNPEKFTEHVKMLEPTQEVYTSKGSMELTIVMKRGYNSVQFDEYVARIKKLTLVKSSYNITVTQRKVIDVDGVIDYEVKVLNPSVPKLIMLWLKARLESEIKSLEYRIGKQNHAIDYSKLLIFACDKLDVIFKALRQPDSAGYMVKHLKITLEQASNQSFWIVSCVSVIVWS